MYPSLLFIGGGFNCFVYLLSTKVVIDGSLSALTKP